SNMNIKKELGQRGVQVHTGITMGNWLKEFIIPSFFRKSETHGELAEFFAKEFLQRDIGGDSLESIGDIIMANQEKKDGIIHLSPFCCIPEIISQNLIPNIRNKTEIPIVSFMFDEHMAKTGFITRLEAFIDLAKHNKQRKKCIMAL
ncbi:MAG: CoA protein activase, partial [Candidatus Aenigmarchaeota archaeon]|nr:CoA protein activase [Candidatus Aenigmarchaeota archaeon]